MGVENVEKFNPSSSSNPSEEKRAEMASNLPHFTLEDSETDLKVGLYSFLTFKEPQLAHLMNLDLKKEPFNLQDKYFVDCTSDPGDTAELSSWGITVQLEPSFLLKGEVIKGKQLGRTIGIPTANLKLTSSSQYSADTLLPGVYYGVCFFENEETQYQMVASFGTNSTLNEKTMNYEILILHDFQKREFYGVDLNVEVQGFIRPESKFDGFDVFIRAMECDVAVAKKFLKMRANF